MCGDVSTDPGNSGEEVTASSAGKTSDSCQDERPFFKGSSTQVGEKK